MKQQLFIIVFSVIFSACGKEIINSPSIQSEEIPKVKTASYGPTVSTYTYDGRGRQLTCDNNDGIKRVYAYSIGNFKESIYRNGVLEYFYKNDLSVDSLCIREIKSNDPSYEQLYQYNPDRTIAKVTTKRSGVTTQLMDFFYSNGNCDSIKFTNSGQWMLTVVKTYYNDRPNVFGPEIFGNEYYGKGSINLLKTETFIYAGCSPEPPLNYSYEYNSSGRVIKETSVKANAVSTGLYTYY